MNTSSIAAWTRKVFRADLGVVCVSTYQRVTEAEALRGTAFVGTDRHASLIKFLVQADSKWCSGCGDWVNKRGFSEDKRNADGLHVHCKTCRAEHQRKLYALMREAQGKTVRPYRKASAVAA